MYADVVLIWVGARVWLSGWQEYSYDTVQRRRAVWRRVGGEEGKEGASSGPERCLWGLSLLVPLPSVAASSLESLRSGLG
jgi:hypothetical protein